MNHITPKKSLGQHWLHDIGILENICESADVKAGDTVLEIGPGLGTLTKQLLERGANVVAVEFDHDLSLQLKERLAGTPIENLTVIEHDILTFDVTTLPKGYKVVANIPYYLTSNLLRVLCESKNPFSVAALLMQKEVAERVDAQPGSMSILSVTTQFYCDVQLGVYVPAHLFTPPPKVDSQVLVLHYRNEPIFPIVDPRQYFRIVKAGFSQKRKTLLNSLSGGLALSKEIVSEMLQRAEISPKTRAQELDLAEWMKILVAYKRL